MRSLIIAVGMLVGCGQVVTPLAATAPSSDNIAGGYSYNKKQALKAKDTASSDIASEAMNAKDATTVNAENGREYTWTRGPQEMRHGKQRKDGINGVQGNQGDMGAAGETGSAGAAGSNGSNGSDGAQGRSGSNGVDGEDGAKGDTGEQGIAGEKGDRGPRGRRGKTGAQGGQGVAGEKGDKGDRGPRGRQGNQGNRGEEGEEGSEGDSCSLERIEKRCYGHSHRLYYKLQITCGEDSEILGSYNENHSPYCRDND